jgi:bifunctional DNase/RNase
MQKIELEITAIVPSGSTSGAYSMVLKEVEGERRLPIVIGQNEAQSIAIELEKMKPSRPLTHDLFKHLALGFDIQLEEVLVYNLVEGIFFAKLMCNRAGELVEIDARSSDAVALAVRFDCSIFCYDHVMDEAGVDPEHSEEIQAMPDDAPEHAPMKTVSDFEDFSGVELQDELDRAIKNENYERASILRDELDRRAGK